MPNLEGRRGTVLLMVPVALLIAGCATMNRQIPDRWLEDPKRAGPEPYGGWVEMMAGDTVLAGELIAVTADTIYFADAAFRSVAVADISRARLVTYGAESLAGTVFLGTLSTLANGWLLIFTAPTWIIGGTIAASRRSYEPLVDYPDQPLTKFRPFSRYPAGLPGGLDRSVVLRKLVRKPL